MLDRVQLSLMIGTVVPVPAPKVVMEALTSVEVTTSERGTAFQLTLALGNRSPLQTLFLIAGSGPILFMRVIIAVTVNGTPTVLADGVITDHQIGGGSDDTHSSLVITGEDISVLMNQQDFSGFPFPATPAEGRVALLLAKYALFGVVPLIVPSVFVYVPLPTANIPGQRGTDLTYIRSLAAKVGYVFYIDPGPVPGANVAYWGPQIKVGVPQPALNALRAASLSWRSAPWMMPRLSRLWRCLGLILLACLKSARALSKDFRSRYMTPWSVRMSGSLGFLGSRAMALA